MTVEEGKKLNVNAGLLALCCVLSGIVIQAVFGLLPCGSNCSCIHEQQRQEPDLPVIGPQP